MSMAASKASNVLLAKCRAKFGRRLSEEDITTLVNCRTVQEAAAYLKSNTRYASVLEGSDPAAMHRLNVENALKRMLFDEFSALCRYELSVGEWLSDYIIMSGEIKQIMSFLWLLSAGRPEEFLFTLPGFFMQHMDFDYAQLSKCRSYTDFLQLMRSSRYSRVLRAFAPLDGEGVDCAAIEHALYDEFYKTVLGIIKQHYKGAARDELLDIIITQMDMRNFCHVYRMKKYYGAEPDTVRAMLLGNDSNVSQRLRNEIINESDPDEVMRLFMERSGYGRKLRLDISDVVGVEFAARRILFAKAVRMMRFSIHPASVLLSYIIFAETEVQDITTIVEAVHYKTPPEEILKLITIDYLMEDTNK